MSGQKLLIFINIRIANRQGESAFNISCVESVLTLIGCLHYREETLAVESKKVSRLSLMRKIIQIINEMRRKRNPEQSQCEHNSFDLAVKAQRTNNFSALFRAPSYVSRRVRKERERFRSGAITSDVHVKAITLSITRFTFVARLVRGSG